MYWTLVMGAGLPEPKNRPKPKTQIQKIGKWKNPKNEKEKAKIVESCNLSTFLA